VKLMESPVATSPSPRVSVVIPTLNRAALLREAIESVRAQSFRDFEIIVVDDGSGDGTAVWLGLQADIRAVFQGGGGVTRARNAGIRAARGELICFLDSDDLWEPEKLARQIAYLDAHPECGLVATEISAFNERGLVPGRGKAAQYPIRTGNVARDLLFANWIQTSTVMVRRACLEAAGPFDEEVGNFGEDWHLWVRIATRYPVWFMPQPLVRYRVHDAGLTSAQPEAQFRSLLRILDKLAAIEPFRGEPWLIAEARYNICVIRAWRNAQAGERALAFEKLALARRQLVFPWRAWLATLRLVLHGYPSPTRARAAA
jgi:glycosyltransferase involved in cell wall biosynthesis